MMDQMTIVVMGVAIILGTASTIFYYFARYYFRTSDQDNELAPGVAEQLGEQQQKEGVVDESKAPVVEVEVQKSHDESVVEKPVVKDLRDALKNTKAGIFGRIKDAFSQKDALSDEDIEELEEILYTSDLGPQTVQRLVESVGEKLSSDEKSSVEKVRESLRDEMLKIFSSHNELDMDSYFKLQVEKQADGPWVLMVVGVNGVGKTTTIGKLAYKAANSGLKTMVVAGDTFRAAAQDQLEVWSQRAEVEIFSPEGVKDPSGVAYEGVQKAKSDGFDVVIVDTAGRLHTQDNLMEELKKVKRVITKVADSAPQETFIVLDSNSGQNAMVQARSFHETLDLTGVVLTKLDGSAKGGVAVGLANELGLEIKFIGVGEGIEDLRPFKVEEFVDSII